MALTFLELKEFHLDEFRKKEYEVKGLNAGVYTLRFEKNKNFFYEKLVVL